MPGQTRTLDRHAFDKTQAIPPFLVLSEEAREIGRISATHNSQFRPNLLQFLKHNSLGGRLLHLKL